MRAKRSRRHRIPAWSRSSVPRRVTAGPTPPRPPSTTPSRSPAATCACLLWRRAARKRTSLARNAVAEERSPLRLAILLAECVEGAERDFREIDFAGSDVGDRPFVAVDLFCSPSFLELEPDRAAGET